MTQNLRIFPPKGNFHGNDKAFLQYSEESLCIQKSVFVLERKPTKVLLKAQEIALIT